MKRILFVDDDRQVLSALRTLLRRQRFEWDMQFVDSGAQALEVLDAGPCDVVVTDMRMPGMDGVQLLAEVKVRQPAAARLVLSGYADHETMLRALPFAHQFLSKPCEPEVLRAAVARVCALQEKLMDVGLRALIGKLDHLPSAPTIYWELLAAAKRPECSSHEFSAIVERDPAVAVKVLQLVNSAYFGLAREVQSIHQAVVHLGVELLKGLALSVHMMSLPSDPAAGLSVDALQKHSLAVATLAKDLATEAPSEVFAAGVVHDIGKLVLAQAIPARFSEVVAAAAARGEPVHVVESEVLGFDHAGVGAYLLGYWGMPLALVEAVAFHHAVAPTTGAQRVAALATHVADALLHAPLGTPADQICEPDILADTTGLAMVTRGAALRARFP